MQGRQGNRVGSVRDDFRVDVAAFPAAVDDARRLVRRLTSTPRHDAAIAASLAGVPHPLDNIFSSQRGGSAPAGGAIPAGREGPVAASVDTTHAPARARTAAAFGPGEDVAPETGLDASRDGGQGCPLACDGEPVHTPSAASVPPTSGVGTPKVAQDSRDFHGGPVLTASGLVANILAVALGSLLLASVIVALLSLAGCTSDRAAGVAPTHFGPPTTAPSVTPAVTGAKASNDAAGTLAGDARDRAAGLTPDNLPAEKPLLLDTLDRLAGAIRATGDNLLAAASAAAANDAAVKAIAAERDEARKLAIEKDGAIATLTTELAEEKAGAFRWVWGGCVAGGVLIMVVGGVVLVFVTPRAAGLGLMAGGAAVMALGLAGSRFGQQIALIGLAMFAAILVGGVWLVIHLLRADGKSMGEGILQLVHAGKLTLDDQARAILAQARTHGADRLMRAETEGKVAA